MEDKNLIIEASGDLTDRINQIKEWDDIQKKRYEDMIGNARTPKELLFGMAVPALGFELLDIADTKFEDMTEEESEIFNECFGRMFNGVKVNGMEVPDFTKNEE